MGTFLYAWLVPHFPVILYYIYAIISGNPLGSDPIIISGPERALLITLAALMIGYHFYSTIRLHIWPLHHKNESGSFRVGVQYGGLLLIRIGIWGFWIQVAHYLFFYVFAPEPVKNFIFTLRSATHTNAKLLLTSDLIYTVLFLFLFLLNGCLRVILCCHRLGVVKRVLICLNIWIPVVNLFLIHYLARAAKDEYDIHAARHQNAVVYQATQECRTKYPLIMVHGIGFRDLKFFNYWGRAPRYLQRSGATIYYGHQKAWGTIEENAAAIAQTIDRALEETGAAKVNIIAHSKGGLDCRFVISRLGYADKVASLTTMSTPHRGSELVDFLNTLPKPLFRRLTQILDRSFAIFGDEAPDSYNATQQLAPAYCKEFNKQTPDAENVLYQSYSAVMRCSFSDSLLFFPHLILWWITKEKNDGLVTESSAQWGTYLGTLKSKTIRGISHGDMIDLKREDIKGFDSIEIYQHIVKGLKEKGF